MHDISQRKFALRIRNFSQLLFSQILAMHTLIRRIDYGLEMKLWAFSIRCAAQNDLVLELDVSALLVTTSLPTLYPFLDSKLFW